jgi:Uncharacterized protein conserved in bacteria (DUF2252)
VSYNLRDATDPPQSEPRLKAFPKELNDYHDWLRTQCAVDEAALATKHEKLSEDSFGFLRASYPRWCRAIPKLCPELCDAPSVLAVGDIHLENYGTWRDAEHRWVWGVNDFDEAARMPYTLDLLRLGVSAVLAPGLSAKPEKIAQAVLKGYAAGLAQPAPVLLDDGLPWLRAALHEAQDDLQGTDDDAWLKLWKKVDAADSVTPNAQLLKAIEATMPAGAVIERCVSLVKGGGSLGRQRIVAIAHWRGGRVLREAKAVVPSAWAWALGKVRKSDDAYKLMHSAHRAPEAGVARLPGWQIRRLAADAHKFDWAEVSNDAIAKPLLRAMAADLAAVHTADRGVAAVAKDLAERNGDWLEHAIERVAKAVDADYRAYKKK